MRIAKEEKRAKEAAQLKIRQARAARPAAAPDSGMTPPPLRSASRRRVCVPPIRARSSALRAGPVGRALRATRMRRSRCGGIQRKRVGNPSHYTSRMLWPVIARVPRPALLLTPHLAMHHSYVTRYNYALVSAGSRGGPAKAPRRHRPPQVGPPSPRPPARASPSLRHARLAPRHAGPGHWGARRLSLPWSLAALPAPAALSAPPHTAASAASRHTRCPVLPCPAHTPLPLSCAAHTPLPLACAVLPCPHMGQ